MKKISTLLLIFFLMLFSCKDKQERTKPLVEKITESVYASGIIKSKNQYQVFSIVNGIIEEIIAKEGDLIKKNDPILRLQNVSSKLNAANAKLAADLASFNSNGDKLNELKANIDFAKTKLKNDSALYARQKNLWAQQIGAQNDLEFRELAYKNSITNYETANLRYKDAKKQLDFSAQQAKNNFEITRSVENDFIVKSETDGRVYSILKEKGELLSPQSPVAIIGDANDFIIELQVDEYDITKIKIGQKIILSLDSYKGKVFEAQVIKINTIMNEKTRSFIITGAFTIKPPVIYPNLTVEGNIIIQSKENALTIPRNYLIDDEFVLNEKKEKIKVNIGLMDYKKVEILSGIKASDIILKPLK
ncbi:MAG: efflux RND transporter periplasmic adaptor subunit [Bacteroidota bacterium]|nr:efflux RND transporter periplasmic adaptor subunit [Bacteroidota bacterium]